MVEIKMPVGKRIYFDETLKDKLHPINIKMNDRRRWNRDRWRDGWNGDDWNMDWDEYNAFYWDSNVDYVMKENGELEKAGKIETTTPGIYEYKKNPAADSLKKQIEERERQLEQEKQRLKELESSTLIRVKNNSKTISKAQLQWPMSAFII
jgi:hypothetical protein